MKRTSSRKITAVIPYYGYARQDRKTSGREAITAKLVADLLTTAGANRVLAMDLHTGQIQGFFNILVDHIYATPVIVNYVKNIDLQGAELVCVSPDMGGANRTRYFAKKLDCPMAIIDKRRNSKLEPEAMNIIGEVKGKDCIMIDDMIDTGKSAVIGANALLGSGANSVKIAAIHPVFSDPCFDLIKSGPFSEVIVTDSIPLDERFKSLDFVHVISLASMLAECIDRIVNNNPLSAVYAAYGSEDYKLNH